MGWTSGPHTQRWTASAVSFGFVLNAILAPGAPAWIAFTSFSKSATSLTSGQYA
jgi:hypothetical protein